MIDIFYFNFRLRLQVRDPSAERWDVLLPKVDRENEPILSNPFEFMLESVESVFRLATNTKYGELTLNFENTDEVNAYLLAFQENFDKVILAGGGVVSYPNAKQSPTGEKLENPIAAFLRYGVFDLPKGKLDPGESLEQCALREVSEEIGIKGHTLKNELLRTYHIHYDKNRASVLKITQWYVMESLEKTPTFTPQTEEGIDSAFIYDCTPANVKKLVTYPNIFKVLEAYLSQ